MPIACSAIASSPDVTCSPDATMVSYSRASCRGEVSVAQPTSSLVLPDIADTTTATSWPASTSRLMCWATLRMRSMLATEVPPNFMTSRPMTNSQIPDNVRGGGRAKRQRRLKKARIHTDEVADATRAGCSAARESPESEQGVDGWRGTSTRFSSRARRSFIRPRCTGSSTLPGILGWVVAVIGWIMERRADGSGMEVFWLALSVVAGLVASTGRSRPGSIAGPPRPT